MNNNYKILIIILLILSIASFIIGIIVFIRQNTLSKNKGKSLNSKLYKPTLCLFLSILLLRFSTSFYGIILVNEDIDNEGLNLLEGLLNSFAHTMQTFSLDAEYTDTITIGKELFANEFENNILSVFYGLYTAFLNILAPIAGGAILLGILTNAFPRLQLWFKPFRKKYIFSELNDKAVYLAKDIIEEARNERKTFLKKLFKRLPLIVFTDAYVDSNNEIRSELLRKAKEIGAICIKNDLLELIFINTYELDYMLLDEEDINNIHTLTTLTTDKKRYWKINCNIRICIFSQNSEVSSIVDKIYKMAPKDEKGNLKLSNVLIKVVQEYTSIAYNLLFDVPLYYPLLTKYQSGYSGNKELVLTIIGGGRIGTEIFLAAYWCGQMLNCKLKINVITENSNQFKASINHINPEILQSGEERNKLLRVYPNQKSIYAEPYASFNFYSVNVETIELYSILDKKDKNNNSMLLSDYFIITLGSDEMNMNIAADINRKIQKEMFNNNLRNHLPVIAYSIYDTNTKEVLNSLDAQNNNSYLYAFAALRNIYSCKNIFMKYLDELAYKLSKKHSEIDMKIFLKNDYNYWSSITRVLHRKYKMYSVDLIKNRDEENDKILANYLEIVNSDKLEYKDIIMKLTWLEHRRWNAFLRTKGFVAPTMAQWENYAYKKDGIDHKNIDLKLHPCIVEGSGLIQIDPPDWDNPLYYEDKKYDYLDMMSIMVHQKQKSLNLNPKKYNRNFKIMDSPNKESL